MAAEPRSFAVSEPADTYPRFDRPQTAEPSLASSASVADPMTGRPDIVEPGHAPAHAAMAESAGEQGLSTPIGRVRDTPRETKRASHRPGGPVLAIAAAVAVVGAVGAAGWYANQNQGVAELTPGGSEMAQAPVTPPASPMTAAATAPMAAASAPAPTPDLAPAPAATAARAEAAPVRTAARARPAAAAPAATGAASASESGLDASATAGLPGGPQPYSSLSQDAAPTAPVTPAPAPAPTPSAPPVIAAPPAAAEPSPVTPGAATDPAAPTGTPPTLSPQ